MKTATDPRHRQRILLMQHLYASQFHREPDEVVSHIWHHLNLIDPVISKIAPEWPLEKLNPIDLAILRLALFELTIDNKAPYKVIIDEAIELAKEFGGQNSPNFINGALGQYIKQYEPSS